MEIVFQVLDDSSLESLVRDMIGKLSEQDERIHEQELKIKQQEERMNEQDERVHELEALLYVEQSPITCKLL